MTDCPEDEFGWHNLHGGCLVGPESIAVALCRNCNQVIGPDGKPIEGWKGRR